MQNSCDKKDFELICVIINYDLGSKVIKIAKKNGITGGTIFLGRGTVKNHILELLDLSDVRREVVIMIGEKNLAYNVLEVLNQKFSLHKPNHGIAFSLPVSDVIGTRNFHCEHIKEKRGAEKSMYNAIFVIVDKGNADVVIKAAAKAGSRGGTVINARGSGIHETSKLFSMDIEPEKEIVLILSEDNMTDAITSSIGEQLKIDEPGNGIIFVQDVSKTYGVY